MDRQLAKQSLARQAKPKTDAEDEDRRASRKARKAAGRKMAEAMPTLHEDASEDTTKQATEEVMQVPGDSRLESFMGDVGMHPDNPDTSSMVVRQAEQSEDRVLTARTNPVTDKLILYDVAIVQDPAQRQVSNKLVEPPFLKEGTHGRDGDFTSDPDCRTGRGHQLNTEDQNSLDEYLDFRNQVLKAYPIYPGVDADEEVHQSVQEGWDANELWYHEFTNRYPGNSVNHLWPCSCEKLRR